MRKRNLKTQLEEQLRPSAPKSKPAGFYLTGENIAWIQRVAAEKKISQSKLIDSILNHYRLYYQLDSSGSEINHRPRS